jgi:hypothetical protein
VMRSTGSAMFGAFTSTISEIASAQKEMQSLGNSKDES